MLKGAVARRYAAAIFDIARRQNTIDRTLDDVQQIAKLFSNRKVSFLMREPKIPAQRKEKALRDAIQGRALPTSLNLALLLVQRNLVEYTPNIASELEQMVRDSRNEAVADVTTATQIDATQTRTIQQALEQRTGKTIIVQPHVDPSILGGVVARVGDQVIDGSIRYRLSVLEQQLLTSVSSSHTDFFTKEELDQTVRDIGSVDTENGSGAVRGDAVYGTTPAASNTDTGTDTNTVTDGQTEYKAVPDSKPTVNRP
jgi:F-type H+-transporting ATPase subunit delta